MVGDEAQLYERLAPQVERIVRGEVHAPREVVEDACHDAWAKLINHSERIERETALSWLVTTAVRQAWKLNRRERRETSLQAASEDSGEFTFPSGLPGPAERVEQRERLDELEFLSERQRRLVWLRAAGLSHVEMAAYTGDTVRTVQRQILRATERMRALQRERQRVERAPDRAALVAGPQRVGPRTRTLNDRGVER